VPADASIALMGISDWGLEFGYWVIGYWGIGYWVIRYWFIGELVIRYSLLEIGYSLLEIGLLVIGY